MEIPWDIDELLLPRIGGWNHKYIKDCCTFAWWATYYRISLSKISDCTRPTPIYIQGKDGSTCWTIAICFLVFCFKIQCICCTYDLNLIFVIVLLLVKSESSNNFQLHSAYFNHASAAISCCGHSAIQSWRKIRQGHFAWPKLFQGLQHL